MKEVVQNGRGEEYKSVTKGDKHIFCWNGTSLSGVVHMSAAATPRPFHDPFPSLILIRSIRPSH